MATKTAQRKPERRPSAPRAPKKVRLEFDGELRPNAPAGSFIVLPPDVSEKLPGKGLIRVQGTVGGVPVKSSLMPDGKGTHCLGVHKATITQGGFKHGDSLRVSIEVDDSPREVTVPPDLSKLLARASAAKAAFARLAYTHRKEYVRWIEEAKKPETRQRRLEKTVEMLSAGRTLS